MKLKDKIAIVTGAAQGFGKGVAEAMLEDMEKLEELQKTIKTISGDKPLDKENKKTVYKAEADRKLLNCRLHNGHVRKKTSPFSGEQA